MLLLAILTRRREKHDLFPINTGKGACLGVKSNVVLATTWSPVGGSQIRRERPGKEGQAPGLRNRGQQRGKHRPAGTAGRKGRSRLRGGRTSRWEGARPAQESGEEETASFTLPCLGDPPRPEPARTGENVSCLLNPVLNNKTIFQNPKEGGTQRNLKILRRGGGAGRDRRGGDYNVARRCKRCVRARTRAGAGGRGAGSTHTSAHTPAPRGPGSGGGGAVSGRGRGLARGGRALSCPDWVWGDQEAVSWRGSTGRHWAVEEEGVAS